jgi:UDP-glucose 4-epimerase
VGASDECLPLSADPQRWQASLQAVDCVVHLAAYVHEMGRRGNVPAKFNALNVEGSRFVAEQCARAGVKRLVFLSSIKVNGEGGNSRGYFADDPPDPQDAYARSKLGAEMAIRDVCRSEGIELVIIRPPLVYGPGVRANFRRLMQLAKLGLPLPFGSIDNRRSLIGVGNLADFIQTCMTHPDAAGEVWLISDGEDLSTTELMRKLLHLMDSPDRLFAVSPRWLQRGANLIGLGAEMHRLCDSLVVDSAPAFERLNWRPIKSVDEGLALTVEAFEAERKP